MTAAFLGIFAELDARITAQAPRADDLLIGKEEDLRTARLPGVNHAFHNDTGPRYQRAAAVNAWAIRSILRAAPAQGVSGSYAGAGEAALE